jgi:hypothetical protein
MNGKGLCQAEQEPDFNRRRTDTMEKLKDELLSLNPNLRIIVKGTDLSCPGNAYLLFRELEDTKSRHGSTTPGLASTVRLRTVTSNGRKR